MAENTVLDQLVALSNNLGRPELDYAILGEGNTSARADDAAGGPATFWVKSSGTELRTITAAGFVHVAFDRVLALMDRPNLSDADVKAGLTAAKVDPAAPGHPSVETLLHALCLQLPGISFIGHTHATAVNMLTCSVGFEQAYAGRLFPDEIVLCGPAPVLVPYTDPGVPLAKEVWARVQRYLDHHGEQPKVIMIQNHGLIALGRSAQHVLDVTAMAVKTARILLGTYAAGGPRFLSEADVARIHTRPDEHFRKLQLGLESKG
jgi:rhamnose utilization protein RhaD (predicted bifunctional aldolase and dehydrogenase)